MAEREGIVCIFSVLEPYGRNVMGTSLYLRVHHFPTVYSGVVH